MDSSLYRIATHLKELVKFLHHGNEISAKLSAQEAKTLLQSFGKTKLFSTLHLNLLFKDIIQFMSTDEDSIRVFQAKCMSLVKDVLIQHPLLQCELFCRISVAKQKLGCYEDAIVYEGQALLIRLEIHGILHEQTSVSHYNLGHLYKAIGAMDKARREFAVCRGIRSKLYGENSAETSMCDIGLGQVECLAMEYSQAYVYFYKAYRSRYLCLGAEHSLTLSAKDNALQLRNITGERIINGMELKDRIIELEWYEEEIHSFQYSIAVFIARLSDDDCLTLKQLKQLIKAAVNFSISRLACTLDLEPQSPRKVKSSIDSLTMLLMFSALPASSPTKKQKLEKSFEVFDDFTGDYPYESATDSGTEKLPQKPISEESTIMVESPIILPVKDAITPTESMGKNESNQSRFKIRSQAAVMVAGSDATFTRPEKSRKSSIVRRQSSVLMGNAITKRPTNQNHTLSLYELPLAIKRKPFVFLRDFDQKLVTVKILSMKEALNTLGPKLFAIGVMQWLVKRNFFISKDKSTKPVDAMYQQIIVPAVVPTVVPIIASGNDEEPESVKTTLLGRIKNSQLVLSAGVDEFPPVPPPLPTVWPPEVFTGASAEISSDGIAAASSEVKGPKMKQVFLHSLSSVDGTLWAEPVDVQIPTQVLFDDLEEEFSLTAKPKKPVNKAAASTMPVAMIASRAGRKAENFVLDAQRAQHLNIMLAKFGKRSPLEIAQDVENFEAEILGIAAVSALAQFIPTKDEISKVKLFIVNEYKKKGADISFTGEESLSDVSPLIFTEIKLGKAEQYVYVMSKVQNAEDRIFAMNCVLSAKETAKFIVENSTAMLKAVEEVKGSARLKFILRAFLDLSNNLLKFSKSSECSMPGFSLSSLNKLQQTKSNSGENVLQYVVTKIMQHFPEALDLLNDMPSIEQARGVIFPRMVADLKKLEDGLQVLKVLIDNEQPASRAFEVMQDQHKTCHQTFMLAERGLKDAQKDFEELCKYFGEGVMDPEALFGQILDFLRSIDSARNVTMVKMKRKARQGKLL